MQNGVPITRVLRNTLDKSYFNGEGWTKDRQKAKFFGDQASAVKACIEKNLRQVELVLRINNDTTFCARIR